MHTIGSFNGLMSFGCRSPIGTMNGKVSPWLENSTNINPPHWWPKFLYKGHLGLIFKDPQFWNYKDQEHFHSTDPHILPHLKVPPGCLTLPSITTSCYLINLDVTNSNSSPLALSQEHNYQQRSTIVKSMASAMSTYAMTSFALPSSLCLDIDGRIQTFWWGHSDGNKKPRCLKV